MNEATTQTEPAEDAITSDQATALVGKHILVVLEDVIHAHEAVVLDAEKSEVQKANARRVIAAAQGFGRPLYAVVKTAERPRILRPERSIHVVRG
jgi:hypothetical protein